MLRLPVRTAGRLHRRRLHYPAPAFVIIRILREFLCLIGGILFLRTLRRNDLYVR